MALQDMCLCLVFIMLSKLWCVQPLKTLNVSRIFVMPVYPTVLNIFYGKKKKISLWHWRKGQGIITVEFILLGTWISVHNFVPIQQANANIFSWIIESKVDHLKSIDLCNSVHHLGTMNIKFYVKPSDISWGTWMSVKSFVSICPVDTNFSTR